MFIIYENGSEAIVTTLAAEKQTLKEFFKKGDRDLDDYDRYNSLECAVLVTSKLTTS